MVTIELGKRIRVCRQNEKLSLKELATRINISLRGLWNIEKGYNYPSYQTAIKLKEVLPELTFDELN